MYVWLPDHLEQDEDSCLLETFDECTYFTFEKCQSSLTGVIEIEGLEISASLISSLAQMNESIYSLSTEILH